MSTWSQSVSLERRRAVPVPHPSMARNDNCACVLLGHVRTREWFLCKNVTDCPQLTLIVVSAVESFAQIRCPYRAAMLPRHRSDQERRTSLGLFIASGASSCQGRGVCSVVTMRRNCDHRTHEHLRSIISLQHDQSRDITRVSICLRLEKLPLHGWCQMPPSILGVSP